jgi:hypothetical protein
MRSTHELTTIPDDELLRRLVDLLHHSRRTEADLVAHVGEVDARRLYAREASRSMFAYCTERLHLSDAEAYLRIAAARASREHPVLLEMLADGRLHLTAIAKLAPHLTAENREALLQRATHRSKRQIEELIAELAPRPDAPALMRKLPEPRIGVAPPAPAFEAGPDGAAPLVSLDPDRRTTAAALCPDGVVGHELRLPEGRAASQPGGPENGRIQLRPDAVPKSPMPGRSRPAVVEPLAPGRYRVQFTASAELHEKLERLRGLMRSSVPDGDLAAIIEQAVTEKLERLEARRFARAKASRKALPARNATTPGRASSPMAREGSSAAGQDAPAVGQASLAAGQASPAPGGTSRRTRHIPATVRRAVYERDGGRCSYVDGQGRRCPARDRLEYHHRHPFGHGGRHCVDGISLLCQAHNLHLAEVDYGREAMRRHRRPRTESRSLDLRI